MLLNRAFAIRIGIRRLLGAAPFYKSIQRVGVPARAQLLAGVGSVTQDKQGLIRRGRLLSHRKQYTGTGYLSKLNLDEVKEVVEWGGEAESVAVYWFMGRSVSGV